MFTDVSIDLETLGVRPGSVITQIGLCAFNRDGSGSKSATNITVNPQTMIDRGFFVDWSTVSWWLKQNEAARVGMADQQGHEIDHALFRVGDWFANELGMDHKKYCVWGHGCGFDCTQLEIAFQRLGMPVPWDFRNVRDLRTLIDFAQAYAVPRPTPRVEHNAMDDAVAQADWIIALTNAIYRGAPEAPFQP
jgi:exodeoxyribonuclease VIII